jgi:hypothetical protein
VNLRTNDFRPGERLSAAELNAIRRELARLGNISFVPPIAGMIEGVGVGIWYTGAPDLYVKLTSGGAGGKYAWTRQVEVTGGGWANAPGSPSGTTAADPAWEINSNASVNLSPNPIVPAWRDASGVLRFIAGSC